MWNVADRCELKAWWRPAPRTEEEDARFVVALLESVRRAIPTIHGFGVLRPSPSGKPIAEGVSLDVASIAAELRAAKQEFELNDDEGTRTFYEQRFFDLAGRFDHPALSIRAGLQRPSTLLWLENELRLELPTPDWARDRDAAYAALLEWMELVVTQLSPTRAFVTPPVPPPVRELPDGYPTVSWMMYLADDYGPIGPVLPPIAARRIGRGTLLTTAPYQYDPAQPSHRDALRTLDAQLHAAGVIKPLWP